MTAAERVAECADLVGKHYLALHGEASGLEQIMYGEMCDAFRLFADYLRESDPSTSKPSG